MNFKVTLRWTIILGFVFLASLSLATPAYAFEENHDGIIPADQIINDDLLISAETIVIDGIVNGDVLSSSNHTIINGTINGNLILNTNTAEINGFVNGSLAAACQQLVINSTVSGSIYFAGAELVLGPEAQINHNILFFGFSLVADPDSNVGTDIHGTGYQVNLEGFIGGNILLDVAAAEISGRVGGDASLMVGEPKAKSPRLIWLQIWSNFWESDISIETIPMGLRISPEAEIDGQLSYKSGTEQADTILAKPGGGVEFTPDASAIEEQKNTAKLWVVARLREVLTLLALGGLAIWLLPNTIKRSGTQLRTKPLNAFGWGLASLVTGYAGILFALFLLIVLGVLLAIVTLGGLANAVFWIGTSGLVMIASTFTLLVIYGSKIVVAYLLGEMAVTRSHPNHSHLSVLALLFGIAIYMLLRSIPIVSVIVGILATLFGMGALAMAIKSRPTEKLSDEIGSE